ncbi:hypothetical protein [Nocardia niigatensis]|uniref:hypothetical protein n=1 Tax=Nocardia niigatensis TaxID=209249 RepID=UPI0002D2A542|nr:hypothetical protein [Nocardia niigatensis]
MGLFAAIDRRYVTEAELLSPQSIPILEAVRPISRHIDWGLSQSVEPAPDWYLEGCRRASPSR